MRTIRAISVGVLQLGLLGSWGASSHAAETLTIATVNNPDMIVMEELSPQFEAAHPDIKLRWVTMDENTLRQRVTTDVATHAGQLDIVTVGIYEVPIWSRLGWLAPLTDIPASYRLDDVFGSLRAGLVHDNQLYSLPFYGESTFTIYRTDLFKAAGLTMPDAPTWDQIASLAKRLNDPSHGTYGICLRGKPGWGENIGFLSDMVNSFGGRWFDMKWHPQLTSPAWEKAVSLYVDLLRNDGPPGAVTAGYNDNLALFANGKCAIWVDATVSASFLADPKQSQVVGHVGYAQAPVRDDDDRLSLSLVLDARRAEDHEACRCGKDLHLLGYLARLHQARRQGAGLGCGSTRNADLDL